MKIRIRYHEHKAGKTYAGVDTVQQMENKLALRSSEGGYSGTVVIDPKECYLIQIEEDEE